MLLTISGSVQLIYFTHDWCIWMQKNSDSSEKIFPNLCLHVYPRPYLSAKKHNQTNQLNSKDTPLLLSDFYTASPSLRVSIKQQCCCLADARLISFFEMTKRTYAKLSCF